MAVDVSVVIACYNVERYIQRTVASALDQEGLSIEVIVVDDASTDSSWQMVSAIQDPRVKSLRLDINGGPSVARNAGFAMALGTWIAVLDGDDLYRPGRLKLCIDRAEASGADIVADNPTIMVESDGTTRPMFDDAAFRALEPMDLARFISGNRLFAAGYTLGYLKPVFRTGFLREKNLSYDPALRIGEDYLLFAAALASGAICAIEPSQGYVYMVRAGSISHRLSLADIDRMKESDTKFLTKYTLDARTAAAQAMRTRSMREAYAYTLLIDAMKRRNLSEAIRAIRHCPSGLRYLGWPVLARLERLKGRVLGRPYSLDR